MATGDQQDIVSRLWSLLPPSWFAQATSTPNVTSVLTGFAKMASWAYGLIAFAKAQTRLLTSSGIFIDLWAFDRLGLTVSRRQGEVDALWAARVQKEILRKRVTRAGVSQAIKDLTGNWPVTFEPWNPGDCGSWASRTAHGTLAWAWGSRTLGSGYGGGLWGSRSLAGVSLLTIARPGIQGVASVGGWASRSGTWTLGGWGTRTTASVSLLGPFAFTSRAENAGPVTDQDIYDCINLNKAAGVAVFVQLI